MSDPMPYEILPSLMRNYFHQDFEHEFGLPSSVVDAFLSRYPQLALGLAREVSSLLTSVQDESELEQSARRLGAYYAADWDGGTYRAWFESIESRARAFAADHLADGA